MEYRIATISGDGIGPEIVREAKKVLDKVGQKYGHNFNYEEVLMGGISIDTYGVPLTDEALETAKKSRRKCRQLPLVRCCPELKTGGRTSRNPQGLKPVREHPPGLSLQ